MKLLSFWCLFFQFLPLIYQNHFNPSPLEIFKIIHPCLAFLLHQFKWKWLNNKPFKLRYRSAVKGTVDVLLKETFNERVTYPIYVVRWCPLTHCWSINIGKHLVFFSVWKLRIFSQKRDLRSADLFYRLDDRNGQHGLDRQTKMFFSHYFSNIGLKNIVLNRARIKTLEITWTLPLSSCYKTWPYTGYMI